MKKFKIFVFAFIFLIGCTEIHNQKSGIDRISTLKNIALISLDQNCFIETDKNLPINFIIEKIKQNYNVTSKISEKGTVCECTSINKKFPELKCYVKCHYLGQWNDYHVVFRYYETGGTGRFTDILLCSTNKNIIHIDKVLIGGDRALDGIVNRPILKNGRVYFRSYLSISSLAGLSAINEKYILYGLSQASQDYWNISDCMYDLKNDKLYLLSILVNPNNEYSANVNKILKLIIPDNSNNTINITQSHISDFLKKFKSAYLLIHKDNHLPKICLY